MGADPNEKRSILREMYMAAFQLYPHAENGKKPRMAARILIAEVAVGIFTPSKPASTAVTKEHKCCPNFEQCSGAQQKRHASENGRHLER